MKKAKAIRHKVEQKTADRKHARRRKRPLFRLAAKMLRVRNIRALKEVHLAAQAKAKEDQS